MRTKITRLLLENFIGIKNKVLNEDIIELKFSDENTFVELRGPNGSGKSTIISQLHPFSESFDSRKKLTLDNTIGRKEIDIEFGDSVYNIIHVYKDGKVNSSFVKDGEELNPTGKVRTFENLVKSEFGIDKTFSSVSKISDDTSHLIEFNSSERKTYFSDTLESVNKYNDAYKIADSKFKICTAKLKDIETSLGKYEKRDVLENSLNTKNAEVKDIEREYIETEATKSINLHRLNELNTELEGLDIEKVRKNKVDSQTKKTNAETGMRNIYLKYKNLPDFDTFFKVAKIEDHRQTLIDVTSKLAVSASKAEEFQNKINGFERSIESQRSLLQNLNESENFKVLDEKIALLKGNIKECEDTLVEINNEMNIDIFNDLGTEDILREKENFKIFSQYIINEYETLVEIPENAEIRNIESFERTEFIKDIERDIIKNNSDKSVINSDIERDNAKMVLCESNLDQYETYKKRPKDCAIDTCPFITKALAFKNVGTELEEVQKSLECSKAKLKLLDDEYDKLEGIKANYEKFTTIFKQTNIENNILYKFYVSKYGTITTAMIKRLKFNIVDEMTSIIDLVEDYVVTKKDLEDFNKDLASTESYNGLVKEKTAINDKVNAEIAKIEKERDDLKAENIAMVSENEENLKLKNFYSQAVADLTEFETLSEVKTTNEKLYAEYENAEAYIVSLIAEKTKLENESIRALDVKSSELSRRKVLVEEEIRTLNTSLDNITKLSEDLIHIEENYAKIKIVRDALSPKSGIPMVFVQTYLGITESVTNQLLSVAFNGQFSIKFVFDAKYFFIQFRDNDIVKDDIRLGSQGERALVKLSISLALLEQRASAFNIITLDEIDGPLDEKNRKMFIDILQKQVERLGIEQVFIISHNEAFADCEMDLIDLHPDKVSYNDDQLVNKNVIYTATNK